MAKKQTVAKNALPAAVVPRRDRAKGNREERGGHHAAIWTDLSVKHTEEIKVMQAPLKCASMLGHRLRVDKIRMIHTHTHGHFPVLFKPTKARTYPFRPTPEEAMSYFVGGKNFTGGYDEDGGFAINGGEGWGEVVFTNHAIDVTGPAAITMGTYHFTNATTGAVVKVEYTFGYKRCAADGKPRIFLHHSSVPYEAH